MNTLLDPSKSKVVGRLVDNDQVQTLFKDEHNRFFLQKVTPPEKSAINLTEELTETKALQWVYESQLKNINQETLKKYFDATVIDSFNEETFKPPMYMSKNQDYENKNLSWTENLQLVRNYVVERSNTSDPIDKVFQKYHDKVTIPEVKNIFSEYYQKSEKAFFKGGKVDVLTNTLMDLYKTQSNALTGDTTMGERFGQDKGFRNAVKDESKNLHSGTTFFSIDMATREIKTLRVENNRLQSLNLKLNTALTNLVSNVRERFGLKEKEIDTMMEKGPLEKVPEQKPLIEGAKSLGKDSSLGV